MFRIQIEPAKPFEKKSEIMKKISNKPGDPPAPPPAAAAAQKAREKQAGQTKNGAAYQVRFFKKL